MRLSSLLLLLGIGSYVCYKILKWKRRKNRKWRSLDLLNYLLNGCEDQSPDTTPNHGSYLTVRGLMAKGYDLTDNEQFSFEYYNNCNLNKGCTSIIDANEMNKIISLNRSFSWSSIYGTTTSPTMPTSTTVNKIDQVLNQIEDIKRSVIEIDCDLNILEQKNNNIDVNKNLMKLTASSSFDDDTSIIQDYEQPSLEWDCGGDCFLLNETNNLPLSSTTLFDRRTSFTRNNHMNSTQNSILTNDLSLSSTSGISSTSFNLKSSITSSMISSSSVETQAISSPSLENISNSSSEPDNIKVTILQKLLDEANRLGVFNDLVNLLNKKSKRDSAYSED